MAVAALFLTGCSCEDPAKKSKPRNEEKNLEKDEIAYVEVKTGEPLIQQAVAEIRPIKGEKVKGIVTFIRVPNGIQIIADLEGLTPGEHGFHIHEFGDCGGDGGAATGGHFNPDNKKHGAPDSEERHVGDLGNVTADASGKAHYERTDRVVAFEGKHSIIGRSIVVHAGKDDFVTQPTGNAGKKVGCGIIESIEHH